jgi:hypothetical protein
LEAGRLSIHIFRKRSSRLGVCSCECFFPNFHLQNRVEERLKRGFGLLHRNARSHASEDLHPARAARLQVVIETRCHGSHKPRWRSHGNL